MDQPTKNQRVYLPVESPLHMEQLHDALLGRQDLLERQRCDTPTSRLRELDQSLHAVQQLLHLTTTSR